jgi:hypothetical protein
MAGFPRMIGACFVLDASAHGDLLQRDKPEMAAISAKKMAL